MSVRRVPGENISNGPTCEVTEFGRIGDGDMAEAIINGRYPEAGFGVNHTSDMLVYIVSGSGVLVHGEAGLELHPQKVIQVDKETPYYFEGENLRIIMVCSPAWQPEQYEQVELE